MNLLSQYLSYLQTTKKTSSSFRKKHSLLDEDFKAFNNFDASLKEKVAKRSYRLKSRCRGIYFTNRESKCIKLLLRGKTIIEVATILNLSQNTVKDYIKRVKVKVNCHSKPRLIDYLHANRITKKNKLLSL